MGSNAFPLNALLAGPVEQQHEAPKEGEEKKGSSQKRRERRKNKKVEGTALGPSAVNLPALAPLGRPPSPTTIVDLLASSGNDPPISASSSVPPPSFSFGPITTTFGMPLPADRPLPPVNKPSHFAFGPITTSFTQPPPPPPAQKTFTEVQVDLRVATAKAESRAKAGDEISALTKALEESEKELNGSREELERTKADLENAKMEVARAKNESKSALEALEAQLGATKVRLDDKVTEIGSIKTELDSEKRSRQGFEAELGMTREALVVSNKKKLPSGLTLAWRLPIFLLVLFFPLRFIWTWMQLPLAVVVSRIDSAHMYPEVSEAWMTMNEFGWFEG